MRLECPPLVAPRARPGRQRMAGAGAPLSTYQGDTTMSRAPRLPESLTAVERESVILCNILIREVCLHELRLAKAMAEDEYRDEVIGDYHEAVYSTHGPNGIRAAIYRLYSDPVLGATRDKTC